MSTLRLAFIAFFAWVGMALAQAPPPVPALPDTPRITSYSLSASNCACAVNFALYGDSTDYWDWVEVWVNGVNVPYNGTNAWTITSPTGPLATIPRPISDGVLTFTNAVTGTVEIVGARRPRRVTQFTESRGVAARDLNQALTDIVAQNRETWDRTNDLTGRAILSQPGNVVGNLPLPALCANAYLGFDSTGLNPNCVSVVTPGTLVLGTGVQAALGNPINGAGGLVGYSLFGTGVAAALELAANAPGGMSVVPTAPGLQYNGPTGAATLTPVYDVEAYGASPVASPTTNASSFQAAFNAAATAGGQVHIPCGHFTLNSTPASAVAAGKHVQLHGDGRDCAVIAMTGAVNGPTLTYTNQWSSVGIDNLTVTTDQIGSVDCIVLGAGYTNADPAQSASNSILNVGVRGDDKYGAATEYCGVGVIENGVSNLDIDGLNSAGPSTKNGISLSLNGNTSVSLYSVQINITNSHFFNCSTGVYYGNQTQGVQMSVDNITHCPNGVSTAFTHTGPYVLSGLLVVASQFDTTYCGICINDGTFANAQINNNQFIIETGTGLSVSGTNFAVTGGNEFNAVTTAGTTGVYVGTTYGNGGLIGNNHFANLGTGIAVSAASQALLKINPNLFQNDTADYSISSSALSVEIDDNYPRALSVINAQFPCVANTLFSRALQSDGGTPTYGGAPTTGGAAVVPLVCQGAGGWANR